jgi:hypothetical protein
VYRDAWPFAASELMTVWRAEWYLCSLQPAIRQVLLSLDDQEEVAEVSHRLNVPTLTEGQLRERLHQAHQRDPRSGFYTNLPAAVAYSEELARRRTERAAVALIAGFSSPIHEGGWDATQSLAFFRSHNIRGRLIGTRGWQGLQLREYTCLTRCLDDKVVEFPHRILAKTAHHNV